MYRKVIRRRVASLVFAIVILIIWDAIMVWVAMSAPACWIIVAVITVFPVLMLTSFAHINGELNRMKSEYPGDLVQDIDSCEQYVAEKYFFLDRYLVDPFNGRMICYDDITSVTTYDIMSYESGRHTSKLVKIFTRDSFKPCRFDDFNKGGEENTEKAIKNYVLFVELLRAHVSSDVKFENDTINNISDIKRVLR